MIPIHCDRIAACSNASSTNSTGEWRSIVPSSRPASSVNVTLFNFWRARDQTALPFVDIVETGMAAFWDTLSGRALNDAEEHSLAIELLVILVGAQLCRSTVPETDRPVQMIRADVPGPPRDRACTLAAFANGDIESLAP